MPAGREDRRIQRTRDLLVSSMVSLIRERGFENLTVQDIIDRANVGRSTFYSHFRSKDDLLTSSVDMMRSTLRRAQLRALAEPGDSRERMFAFAHELFVHVEQHQDVFVAMVGKRSGTMVQQRMHRMLADVVREALRFMAARKKRDAMQVEALVQFIAGGLLGLVVTWRNQMAQLKADDLDMLFRRMATPAVEAMIG